MTPNNPLESDIMFAELEDDREEAAPYLSIFIDEATTTLDELVETLLALESGGGKKCMERLFCAAHRIKGSAASIGLNRVAKLAHLMEDLLQAVVDQGGEPTVDMADALLACADGLRRRVDAFHRGEESDDDFPALAERIRVARASLEAVSSPATEAGNRVAASDHSPPSVAPTDDLTELRARMYSVLSDEQRFDALIGRVCFEADLPLAGLKAQLLHGKLSNLGDIRYISPPPEQYESLESIEALEFCVATEKKPEDVHRAMRVAGVVKAAVEPLEQRARRAAAPTQGAKPAETLRVDAERLDGLMNLAGQLAIGKARVEQVADRLKQAVSGANLAAVRNALGDLSESIHLLGRVSDGIQQVVMNMRMLPIGPLFHRFHRVVRDLARAGGKDIRLEIRGESTELDKRMIDELGDPMIHLIRNAADHGIEPPKDRAAAGKPAQAVIALSAFHRGSNIIIQVSDDGRGLDAARIRRKAVECGLVAAADAERMTPAEIYPFIWRPGFSTADRVTDVSGRGVGMDIVRAKIAELNGSVAVESVPGAGTTFTIKLPLTLAILPSLLVESNGGVFALPIESVSEIVRVAPGDVRTVQGRRMAAVRDHVVPILALDDVFRRRRNEGAASPHNAEAITLVVISDGGRRAGLAVQRVLGEQDVVIKSIAENYRNVTGVAGASILGDGRVSLILDPHALVDSMICPGAAAPNLLENI